MVQTEHSGYLLWKWSKPFQIFKSQSKKSGKFKTVASDKVIEQTISKGQEGSGGIATFSTSEATVLTIDGVKWHCFL